MVLTEAVDCCHSGISIQVAAPPTDQVVSYQIVMCDAGNRSVRVI